MAALHEDRLCDTLQGMIPTNVPINDIYDVVDVYVFSCKGLNPCVGRIRVGVLIG